MRSCFVSFTGLPAPQRGAHARSGVCALSHANSHGSVCVVCVFVAVCSTRSTSIQVCAQRVASRAGVVCSCFAACGQTVGWVGQFRYVPVAANNTYTGAFRGAEHGLVRFSFGGKPTKDGIIPASAWKCMSWLAADIMAPLTYPCRQSCVMASLPQTCLPWSACGR